MSSDPALGHSALDDTTGDDAELIERLLAAPSPRDHYDWHKMTESYLAACPLSRNDIPGLIRVMQNWRDDSWPDKNAFPVSLREKAELLSVTAWRALGELRAVEAVPPLIQLLREQPGDSVDDWVIEEWPYLFAKLGPSAVEPLLEVVRDSELSRTPRTVAVSGLRFIAEKHPETRERIISSLVELMEHADETNIRVSSCLLLELVHLRAVEAAGAIERAFSRNALDHGMMGDWDKVRQTLGVASLGLPMPEKPYNSIKVWQEKLLLNHLNESLKRQQELEAAALADEFPEDDSDASSSVPLQRLEKIGRNDPCSCGSGKKYKKCCGRAF